MCENISKKLDNSIRRGTTTSAGKNERKQLLAYVAGWSVNCRKNLNTRAFMSAIQCLSIRPADGQASIYTGRSVVAVFVEAKLEDD